MPVRLYSMSRAQGKIAYDGGMLEMLQRLEIGGGRVQLADGAFRLEIPAARRGYSDAQLDDYRALMRSELPWVAPLSCSVRARTNLAAPHGTLGFGLWNDPFSLALGQRGAARRFPTLPQAAWFFYGSQESDLSLGAPLAGAGWLAMTVRSSRIPAAVAAPAVAAGWLLARLPFLRPALFRSARRLVTIDSMPLQAALDTWHEYRLDWHSDRVDFLVDQQPVFTTRAAPHPPLGFVAWIDNQYLCASPAAGLRFGTITTTQAQVLELEHVSIQPRAA